MIGDEHFYIYLNEIPWERKNDNIQFESLLPCHI